MRIEEQTPQQELRQLYQQVVRREARRNSPLNLRFFLRYAVLFLLFPGMVYGFRAGLLLTGAFSLLLLGFLLTGTEAWGTVAVSCWFGLGVVALIVVSLNVWRAAERTRRQRQQERPATDIPGQFISFPRQKIMRWHPMEGEGQKGRFRSSLLLEAPAAGIYALLLTVDHKGGCRMVTPDKRGMCVVESDGVKGGAFHTLLLYRLAKGHHELAWMADTPDARPPRGTVTQLNRVTTGE